MALATKIRENYRGSLDNIPFESERARRLAETLVDEYVQLRLQEAYLSYVNSAKEHSGDLLSLDEWTANLVRNQRQLLTDIVASAIHKAIARTAEIEEIYGEKRQAVLSVARSTRLNVGRGFEIWGASPFWLINLAISMLAAFFTGLFLVLTLEAPSFSFDFKFLANQPPMIGTFMIVCLVSIWLIWSRRGGD